MDPAGGLGLDLGVRLVGLELEDDAAGLDLLALVDEPLREQDVLGVRAELGHDHRRGHRLVSASAVSRDEDELDVVAAACRAQASPTRSSGTASASRRSRPAAAWPITSA